MVRNRTQLPFHHVRNTPHLPASPFPLFYPRSQHTYNPPTHINPHEMQRSSLRRRDINTIVTQSCPNSEGFAPHLGRPDLTKAENNGLDLVFCSSFISSRFIWILYGNGADEIIIACIIGKKYYSVTVSRK